MLLRLCYSFDFSTLVFISGTISNLYHNEHKIVGMANTFTSVSDFSFTKSMNKWVIEDPYYFNDMKITDWQDAILNLNKGGIFELKKPPKVIFNDLNIKEMSSAIKGNWSCDGSRITLAILDRHSKNIIKTTDLVLPDNDRYEKGVKIFWPLSGNAIGGIIWRVCPDSLNEPSESDTGDENEKQIDQ